VKAVSHTEADLAYAAGFFDGEGHIRIQRHSTRCDTMTLQVQLSQATPQPLEWFVEKFGGTTRGRTIPYRGGRRTIYNWQASSGVAERFLRAIYPYLRCKKDEAEVALLFRETFRPQHVAGGHKRMELSVLLTRASMAAQLVKLRKSKRAAASLVEAA
jgi:hypothetical protein